MFFRRAALGSETLFSQKARNNALLNAVKSQHLPAIHEALSAGADGLSVLKRLAEKNCSKAQMAIMIKALDQTEKGYLGHLLRDNIVEILAPIFGKDADRQRWLLEQHWDQGKSTIGATCGYKALTTILHLFVVNDDLKGLQSVLSEQRKKDIWAYTRDAILCSRPLNETGRWCLQEIISHGNTAIPYCDAAEAGYVEIMEMIDKEDRQDPYIDSIALRKACENRGYAAIQYLVEEKGAAPANPYIKMPDLILTSCQNRETQRILLCSVTKALSCSSKSTLQPSSP